MPTLAPPDIDALDPYRHMAIGIKEFLLAILNEREDKYHDRFREIEAELKEVKTTFQSGRQEVSIAIKEAFANSKEVIAAALLVLDKRFETVTAFQSQWTQQQVQFARKSEVEVAMQSAEKAINKAESAVEKRFDSVNEFRALVSDMITTLARKTEVDIQLLALEKKIDATVIQTQALAAQIQINEGRRLGIMVTWAAFLAIAGLGIAFLFHH